MNVGRDDLFDGFLRAFHGPQALNVNVVIFRLQIAPAKRPGLDDIRADDPAHGIGWGRKRADDPDDGRWLSRPQTKERDNRQAQKEVEGQRGDANGSQVHDESLAAPAAIVNGLVEAPNSNRPRGDQPRPGHDTND